MITFLPLGPKVTFTALARASTPFLTPSRASRSNIIFFEEQMNGIHSKLLKKNGRSISRKLKREKVKFKAKDVIDIMTTSVFFYIEESFIKK